MNPKPQRTINCAVIIFLEAQRWRNLQILPAACWPAGADISLKSPLRMMSE